jgi:hypothetical protein
MKYSAFSLFAPVARVLIVVVDGGGVRKEILDITGGF